MPLFLFGRHDGVPSESGALANAMLTGEETHGKIMVFINKFQQGDMLKFVKNDKCTRRNECEKIQHEASAVTGNGSSYGFLFPAPECPGSRAGCF
jgi:hypothetical protein